MFSTHHTGQSEVVAVGARGCGQCAGGVEWFKTHCAIVTLLDIEVCFQPDRNTLGGSTYIIIDMYVEMLFWADQQCMALIKRWPANTGPNTCYGDFGAH